MSWLLKFLYLFALLMKQFLDICKQYRRVLLFVWFWFFRAELYPYIIPAEIPQEVYSWWMFQDYESDALPTTGDIVLFFHADRCPTCVRAEKNIRKSWIPAWLSILKVDYDSNEELRETYWIQSQTSYTQIDLDGKEIKKWVWSTNIEDILERIQ